ncbi:uncharacterized protein AMSG_00726 [Thecamonas trahens ATCC 50062]|uniref:Uncharacterized protein n=1 Tax=Thecamonas trahens ATCC 50062 TaxID=461836 RepID=A0A0L0DEE6_THETB|nr:hypothetical protein AMSG_00726 [Thecamonas trahens ATCC 50062]KNC50565.1 hypothetical protein AMSG_00726 [Thecamonas trahens ATCC 50062]|eukprot:XP_013762455.1 hypothetical protein AMSG_00726 [Thecamonas trahens ATCC 50062]
MRRLARTLFLHGPLRDAEVRALVLPKDKASLWDPALPASARGAVLPAQAKGFELTYPAVFSTPPGLGNETLGGAGFSAAEDLALEAEMPVPLPRPGKLLKGVVLAGASQDAVERLTHLFGADAVVAPVAVQAVVPHPLPGAAVAAATAAATAATAAATAVEAAPVVQSGALPQVLTQLVGPLAPYLVDSLLAKQPPLAPESKLRLRLDAWMLRPHPQLLADVSEMLRIAKESSLSLRKWHLHTWHPEARAVLLRELASAVATLDTAPPPSDRSPTAVRA